MSFHVHRVNNHYGEAKIIKARPQLRKILRGGLGLNCVSYKKHFPKQFVICREPSSCKVNQHNIRSGLRYLE